MASSLRRAGGYTRIDGTAGNDVLNGTGGNDFIRGLDGNDALHGRGGDDVLDGGGWHDLLDGGPGSDWALYDLNTASVRIDLSRGFARFPGQSWADEALISIENAETGSGNDTLIGNAAENDLRGGAGNDLLKGGDGNDRLFGGAGRDTLDGGGWHDFLDGGSGRDRVLYAENTGPVQIDLALGKASFPGTPWGAETLVSIEEARTGSGDDILIGNDAANWFDGGAGDDSLVGGYGNDTLRGGAGDDTLGGGAAEPIVLDGYDERGQMIEALPAINDGADVINGGRGTDTFVTMAAWYDYGPYWTSVVPGVTVDLRVGRATYDSEHWSDDVLVSIENVTTGEGDDRVYGDAKNNVIRVGSGANTVDAGAGDDTIYGGADRTVFGELEDTLRPDIILDVLSGGRGDDEIYAGSATIPYHTDRTGGVVFVRDILTGGSGDDFLSGDVGYFTMDGGTGADVFSLQANVIKSFGWSPAGSYEYFGSITNIRDYDPSGGDVLQLRFEREPIWFDEYEYGEWSPDIINFVGETNQTDMFDLGYRHVSNDDGTVDTIVTFDMFYYEGDGAYDIYTMDSQPTAVQFVLEDYAGEITLDDFIFV